MRSKTIAMAALVGMAALAIDIVIIVGFAIIGLAGACAFVAGAVSSKTTSSRALQPGPKGFDRITKYWPAYYAMCFLFAVQTLASAYSEHRLFDARHVSATVIPVLWTVGAVLSLLGRLLERREEAARVGA